MSTGGFRLIDNGRVVRLLGFAVDMPCLFCFFASLALKHVTGRGGRKRAIKLVVYS